MEKKTLIAFGIIGTALIGINTLQAQTLETKGSWRLDTNSVTMGKIETTSGEHFIKADGSCVNKDTNAKKSIESTVPIMKTSGSQVAKPKYQHEAMIPKAFPPAKSGGDETKIAQSKAMKELKAECRAMK